MFDLALSQNGDLIFVEKQTISASFKLSFTISNAIKLVFDVSNFDPLQSTDNGIKLSFDVKDLDNNKRALVLYDINAKTQLLKIRLQTALGELPLRSTIGSNLELVRHKSLYDQKVISLAQTYVKNAISDIIPNADVKVVPFIDKAKAYSQQINIYIFEDDFLIFQFSLKG